jgi:hypothetical protein
MLREHIRVNFSYLTMVQGVEENILALRRMNKQRNGENCTMGSFIICTHHQILLGRSNQGEWSGQGMWTAWERGETCIGFWWESPKEKDHLKDQGVDVRNGSKRTVGRLAGGGGGVQWIHLAQDRDRWRAVVNAVMNLRVLAPRS